MTGVLKKRTINQYTLSVIPAQLTMLYRNIRASGPQKTVLSSKAPVAEQMRDRSLVYGWDSGLKLLPPSESRRTEGDMYDHAELDTMTAPRIMCHQLGEVISSTREVIWDERKGKTVVDFESRKDFDLKIDEAVAHLQEQADIPFLLDQVFDWRCEFDLEMEGKLERNIPYLEETMAALNTMEQPPAETMEKYESESEHGEESDGTEEDDDQVEEKETMAGMMKKMQPGEPDMPREAFMGGPSVDMARAHIAVVLKEYQQELAACKARLGQIGVEGLDGRMDENGEPINSDCPVRTNPVERKQAEDVPILEWGIFLARKG